MQLFKFFHTENTSNFKIQTAKNGGFCEELFSENDFEAILIDFSCYEYGSNASEAAQALAKGYCSWFSIMGAESGGRAESPPPHQNRCPPSEKQRPL